MFNRLSKKKSTNIEDTQAQTLQKVNGNQTPPCNACEYEKQVQNYYTGVSFYPNTTPISYANVDNQQIHHLLQQNQAHCIPQYQQSVPYQTPVQPPVYVYPVQQVYTMPSYDQSLYQTQQPTYFPQPIPYLYQVPQTVQEATPLQQVSQQPIQPQNTPVQSIEQSVQPTIQYQEQQQIVKQFVDTVKLQLLLQQLSRDVLIQVINQIDQNTLAQVLPQVFPQVLNEVLPQVLPQVVTNTYITEQVM